MNCTASYLPYAHTGVSRIIADYITGDKDLVPFYTHAASIEGIKKALELKKLATVDRKLLVQVLENQYAGIQCASIVSLNIQSLLSPRTYTICTAHQPNIFTGHLYFIYKIVHAVKLADELNALIKDHHFVPVFYMGSEDADLEELGEVQVNGKIHHWKTGQTGAVGRMKVDIALLKILDKLEGELSVLANGKDIIAMARKAYREETSIESATLEFVNSLFDSYGLVVLLPDNPKLKQAFVEISRNELLTGFSGKAVAETITEMPGQYKIQASGREINLFYLMDGLRERIIPDGNKYAISNTNIIFSREEILQELETFPERFSPNVILRPVFQELILPNIVFIGGGGELAYWLELKKVFAQAGVDLPVLILRNSFMVINRQAVKMMRALGLTSADLFKKEEVLVQQVVKAKSATVLTLDNQKVQVEKIYIEAAKLAAAADPTLEKHVGALLTGIVKKLARLEKKMLAAEKKKWAAQQRQVTKVKNAAFPAGILQERTDNLMPYYAQWGPAFIEMIYRNSGTIQQEFCIVEEAGT